MNGLPAGFRTLIDTPQCAQGGDRQSRLQMLDGSDGPARLVFTCGLSWRQARLRMSIDTGMWGLSTGLAAATIPRRLAALRSPRLASCARLSSR